MSFFIRKKSKNLANLTKPAGAGVGGDGGQKHRPRNKDFKPRPANRQKQFGGKRRKFDDSGSGKRPKFDKNEEIESDVSEDDADGDFLEGGRKSKSRSDESQSQDEFFSAEEDLDDVDETAQEKKLRLARMYIEEIEERERKKRDDAEDAEVGSELIASRLKEDVLETEGRLRREVADLVQPDLENLRTLTCSKYLKRSVTCLCVSEDDKWVFSGSKDGHIIKWSLEENKKVGVIKKKEVLSKKQKKKKKKINPESVDPNSCHSSTVTAIAVSSDGRFLVSGDLERQIAVWDPVTLKRIHIFTGHRGAIRGLAFRKKSHTLYSCSDDRSVKIWSLDEMGYVETLFGHQDAVTCIDALSRERAITGGGRDNTIRIWKIVEESQLVYNGHYNGAIDGVRLINEENFLSCGEDGLLCTWNVNRKKPLVVVESPHGHIDTPTSTPTPSPTPRWISSIAAWTNTDLVVSGSNDGFLRFWKCGERFKSLSEVFKVPCKGWVNCVEFSSMAASEGGVGGGVNGRRKFLVVGTGKEHRLGRWFQDVKEARNGILIVPLKPRDKDKSDTNDSDNGNEIVDQSNENEKDDEDESN